MATIHTILTVKATGGRLTEKLAILIGDSSAQFHPIDGDACAALNPMPRKPMAVGAVTKRHCVLRNDTRFGAWSTHRIHSSLGDAGKIG